MGTNFVIGCVLILFVFRLFFTQNTFPQTTIEMSRVIYHIETFLVVNWTIFVATFVTKVTEYLCSWFVVGSFLQTIFDFLTSHF